MKYGEIIYVSFGSLMPYLRMQSKGSIGKLTRHVLETAMQKPHLSALPPRLEPLLERIQRGLMVMYQDRLPPVWTILLPRIKETFPAFCALRSKDIGLLMRRILQTLTGADTKNDARLPSGMDEHMDQLCRWLSRDIDRQGELEILTEKAMEAAKCICEAQPETILSTSELAALVCIQRLAGRDFSKNSTERSLLRIALSLCEGQTLNASAVKRLVAEALGETGCHAEPAVPGHAAAAEAPAKKKRTGLLYDLLSRGSGSVTMPEETVKTDILLGSVAGMLVTRTRPFLEIILWLALAEQDEEPGWKQIRLRRDLARKAARNFCIADRVLVRGFYADDTPQNDAYFGRRRCAPLFSATHAQKVPRSADYADLEASQPRSA